MPIRLILLTVIWLTACTATSTALPELHSAPAEVSGTPSPATPKPSHEIKVMPSESPPAAEPVPREIIEKVKTDLSQRSLIDVEQIHVVDARTVTWLDASIGCAQPNENEAEGAVPGYQITLEAGGQYHVYHADQGGRIILCPGPTPEEPGLR
jgi:hypothetical protein